MEAAARIVGGKAKLARLLGVRAPTVSQWCSGLRPVPAARAALIEELAGGQVSRADLCPEFPWQKLAS
ncbi:Cro/CI family transcriptional regulator [Pseudomonas sp. MT3]